jgi:O-Antigen ligase
MLLRSAALSAARLVLLAGPTALAFFAGGYFDSPRAWAGLGAWILVAVGLIAQRRPLPLPGGRGGWLAFAGLGALAAWTLISTVWSPIAGNAYHAGQIAVLYLGALAAAALLLGPGHRARRAVEPALAAGALVVIGYGISERLLPGLLSFARSVSAQGRLEQPLTYWNAMGEVAALGLVLCTRVAGSATREAWLRIASAASCAPLGLGLYLSFSRGALFAGAAGLVTLIVVAQRREQLWALLLAIVAGTLASVASAPFRGVTALSGSISTRESQGAVTLVALAAIMLGTAGLQGWLIRRERPAALRLPRRAPAIAAAVICAGLALAIAAGARESNTASQPLSGGATRYVTLQSNRYAYWRVALRAFGQQPLHGVGAGGWSVYWLRWRPFGEFAQDAHSLPLQTLAELGVIGAGLLATFLLGIAIAARDALRAAPGLAAGPTAGFVVWVAHAPLDWDWQMPAVTLIAMILAGALLALDDGAAQSASAIRGASRSKIQTANTQAPT